MDRVPPQKPSSSLCFLRAIEKNKESTELKENYLKLLFPAPSVPRSYVMTPTRCFEFFFVLARTRVEDPRLLRVSFGFAVCVVISSSRLLLSS